MSAAISRIAVGMAAVAASCSSLSRETASAVATATNPNMIGASKLTIREMRTKPSAIRMASGKIFTPEGTWYRSRDMIAMPPSKMYVSTPMLMMRLRKSSRPRSSNPTGSLKL